MATGEDEPEDKGGGFALLCGRCRDPFAFVDASFCLAKNDSRPTDSEMVLCPTFNPIPCVGLRVSLLNHQCTRSFHGWVWRRGEGCSGLGAGREARMSCRSQAATCAA